MAVGQTMNGHCTYQKEESNSSKDSVEYVGCVPIYNGQIIRLPQLRPASCLACSGNKTLCNVQSFRQVSKQNR